MQIILPSATYSEDSWGNIDDTMETEWEAIETYLTDANSQSKLNQKLNQFIKYLKGNNDFGLNFWDKVDCFYIPGIFSSADYLGMNIKTGKIDDCTTSNDYVELTDYDSTDKVLTFVTNKYSLTMGSKIVVGSTNSISDYDNWELFSFSENMQESSIGYTYYLYSRIGGSFIAPFLNSNTVRLLRTNSFTASYVQYSDLNSTFHSNLNSNTVGKAIFCQYVNNDLLTASDDFVLFNSKTTKATSIALTGTLPSTYVHCFGLIQQLYKSVDVGYVFQTSIAKHFYLSAVGSTLTEEQWTDLNTHAQEVIDLL